MRQRQEEKERKFLAKIEERKLRAEGVDKPAAKARKVAGNFLAKVGRMKEISADAAAARAWEEPGSVRRYIFDNLSYHLPAGFDTLDTRDHQQVREFLSAIFSRAVQEKIDNLGDAEVYTRFQNIVVLKAIDVAWVEQVDFLEQLKTVVQDRNVAQHKVEYEYRREAYFAFEEMKKRINRDIVRGLCLSRIEHGADGSLVLQFA